MHRITGEAGTGALTTPRIITAMDITIQDDIITTMHGVHLAINTAVLVDTNKDLEVVMGVVLVAAIIVKNKTSTFDCLFR